MAGASRLLAVNRFPLQKYCFLLELLWWFSPLLISTCNYLSDLLRRKVKFIPDGFVGIHKRKTLFDCPMQEESFDVTVTTRTAFCRAFKVVDYFFFLLIVEKILLG